MIRIQSRTVGLAFFLVAGIASSPIPQLSFPGQVSSSTPVAGGAGGGNPLITTISAWGPFGVDFNTKTWTLISTGSASDKILKAVGNQAYTNSAGATVSVNIGTEYLDLGPTGIIDELISGPNQDFDYVQCSVGANGVARCVELAGVSATKPTKTATFTLTGATTGYRAAVTGPVVTPTPTRTTITAWAPNAVDFSGFTYAGTGTASDVLLQKATPVPYTNSAGATVSIAAGTEYLDLGPTAWVDDLVVGSNREFDFVQCIPNANGVAVCIELDGISGTRVTATATFTLSGRTSGYVAALPTGTAF